MTLRTSPSSRGAVVLVTGLAFLSLQLPRSAFAQGVNVTQGEALYNQGKDLIAQKKYHEACERFAASYKLDENQNTMVALAACHALDGKTATAWGEYLQVAQKARGTPAADYAADQAKAIEPKLLKIKLDMQLVPPDIALKIDGVSYPKDVIGAELPLDPGEHDIEAKAPGKHDWVKHFKLIAAESPFTVKLSLEDMTPEELDAEKKKLAGPSGNAEEITPGDPVKRWIGVGVIAVGVGALAYGVYALAEAVSNTSKFNGEGKGIRNCVTGEVPPGPNVCHVLDSSGLTYADRANNFYIQMGVVGGIGLVAATVGTILVATSFESKRLVKRDTMHFTPTFGAGYAGASLSGSF
ncbi:MAG TPA: hypothetical protein VF316_20895 [Polyangiaceae bacterium]